MFEYWTRLHRDVVESLCLEIFKTQQDTVLGNVLYIIKFFAVAVGLDDTRGSFQPEPFCDSSSIKSLK